MSPTGSCPPGVFRIRTAPPDGSTEQALSAGLAVQDKVP